MDKICTYTGPLWYIPVLAFRSMNLHDGHLSESMTQVGKEMMVGQWRGVLRKLDVRDTRDQSYSRL